MCLTDGEIYIGATYNPPKFFDLDNFNIVKITGQYFDRMKPMYALFNIEISKTSKSYLEHKRNSSVTLHAPLSITLTGKLAPYLTLSRERESNLLKTISFP